VLDPRLSLLVSLDGPDPETVGFCNDWEVPLIYSEQPEGVGISKNRVLERYPDFDYYFFVEDDVELMDDTVFKVHIEISRTSGIHHFSLFERDGIRKPISISIVTGHRIVHALFGGADFNFFTGQGLKVVGGWHPLPVLSCRPGTRTIQRCSGHDGCLFLARPAIGHATSRRDAWP
jgi:hypothetical protein